LHRKNGCRVASNISESNGTALGYRTQESDASFCLQQTNYISPTGPTKIPCDTFSSHKTFQKTNIPNP
uniref:Ovule protein n=1 Tax=Haemonchus placei TaxID=6290 RepID=A0A0N4WKX8_HAEPC